MQNNTKEKIKTFYSNLTKTQSYNYFIKDKTFPHLNLEMIEKKVSLSSYTSLEKFYFDIHRLWNLYFIHCVKTNDNVLLNKIMEMAELSEELHNKSNRTNIKDLNTQNKNNNNINTNNNNKNKNDNSESKTNEKSQFKIRDKSKKFTNDDKTELTYKVQSLNMEQLGNIINVLTDIKPNPKTKTFDFDIYTLSENNLKKLEDYVDECLNLKPKKINKKI
jgi:hypothetical protein